MCSGNGRRFLPVSADTRLTICIRSTRTDTLLWLSGPSHGSGYAAAGSRPSVATDHGRDAP
eukprot:5535688-Pyramimonas_sp.AAC.1